MDRAVSQKLGRRIFVDAAKGIGILLVVAGHTISACAAPWTWLLKPIQAFHMPLFFFLSGLFFASRSPSRRIFGKNGFLVPYLYFSALGLFRIPIDRPIPSNWPKAFDNLYSLAVHGSPWMNGPLWFLVSLAAVSLAFSAANRGLRGFSSKTSRILFLVVCTVSTVAAESLPAGFRLRWSPFMVATIPCGLLFYSAGFFSRSEVLRLDGMTQRRPATVLAIVVVLSAVVAIGSQTVPMVVVQRAVIGSIRFFPLAFAGIAAAILAATALPPRVQTPLAWIGRHSLSFFALDVVVRAWTYKIVYHSFAAFGLKPGDRLELFVTILFVLHLSSLSLVIRPTERILDRLRFSFGIRFPEESRANRFRT